MRSIIAFLICLLAVLSACSSDSEPSVSGSAARSSTTSPERSTPSPTLTTTTTTTTTTPEVVPATAPPTAPSISIHAPAPAPACGGWGDLIAANFPADQVGTACRVMLCESNGNPTAQNPRSTASGLFQFLDGTWRSARAMVGADQYARAMHAPPELQVAAAGAWWAATGWHQWECA